MQASRVLLHFWQAVQQQCQKGPPPLRLSCHRSARSRHASLYVHSHFISSFIFLHRLIPRPLSCTLCHLASSLRWQPSRRSPIKHDCLHLWSHPWHNRYEIRAARSTPRIVSHSTPWLQMLSLFPPAKNEIWSHRTSASEEHGTGALNIIRRLEIRLLCTLPRRSPSTQ